jgi:hypothetical protein
MKTDWAAFAHWLEGITVQGFKLSYKLLTYETRILYPPYIFGETFVVGRNGETEHATRTAIPYLMRSRW